MLYGGKTTSIIQKLTLVLIETLILFTGLWIIASRSSDTGLAIPGNPGPLLLMIFIVLTYLRMLITLLVLLKRAMS